MEPAIPIAVRGKRVSNVNLENVCLPLPLTLYTLKSVYIFSILFFIHFLRCWQGEFVYRSKASFVGDHFLYSHNLNMWFRGNIVRRNCMLITTTWVKRNIKHFYETGLPYYQAILHQYLFNLNMVVVRNKQNNTKTEHSQRENQAQSSIRYQIKRKLRPSCEESLWLTIIRLENLNRQLILCFEDWNDYFILPLVPREDDDNTGAVVYDGNSLPGTICFHVY